MLDDSDSDHRHNKPQQPAANSTSPPPKRKEDLRDEDDLLRRLADAAAPLDDIPVDDSEVSLQELLLDPPPHPDAGNAKYLSVRGADTQTRRHENTAAVLQWVYLHGVIDVYILMLLIGTITMRTAEVTMRKLRVRGLVQRIVVRNALPALYILTRAGRDYVHMHCPCEDTERIDPWIYPSDVPVQDIEHRLLTQIAVLRMREKLAGKPSREWSHFAIMSERLLRTTRGTIGETRKIPDAILSARQTYVTEAYDIHTFALETQQSYDKPLVRERLLTNYLTAIEDDTISAVVYASSRPEILDGYRNLASVRQLWRWDDAKGWRRRWEDYTYDDRSMPMMHDFGSLATDWIMTLDLSDIHGRYYRR